MRLSETEAPGGRKWRLGTLLTSGSLCALVLLISVFAQSAQRRASLPLPTLARLPTVTLSATALAQIAFYRVERTDANTSTSIRLPFSLTHSRTPLALTVTPSQTITETPSLVILPPLEIAFDGVYSLALEFRRPVQNLLEVNRALLPSSRLTVSAYRDIPGWAKITLVPTSLVESGWADVEAVSPVEIIAREHSPREWSAYLIDTNSLAAPAVDIPRQFVDYISPVPPLEGEYRFPWQEGQNWWAVRGWHDGNALDFQPGIGAHFGVLAAQAGRLREICSDGYQSLLEIRHADGRSTYYLHVTLALSTRRQLLDQAVRRGQYLGELIRQDYFVTPCGRGNSRHLHFAVSDRSMSIEGYPLEGIAASASCCSNPPIYRSANLRVNPVSAPP
jgi:murein DD-endopeptidase MepM/ murein hydrolase activator NlpD